MLVSAIAAPRASKVCEDTHLHTKLVLVFFDSSIKCFLQQNVVGKVTKFTYTHHKPLRSPGLFLSSALPCSAPAQIAALAHTPGAYLELSNLS